MSLHELTRKLALSIPRVRRFYAYARSLAAERDELAEGNRKLLHELALATAEAEAGALAASVRERLELELYLLRSDYQRAVDVSERMRASFARNNREIEELKADFAASLTSKDKELEDLQHRKEHAEKVRAAIEVKLAELESRNRAQEREPATIKEASFQVGANELFSSLTDRVAELSNEFPRQIDKVQSRLLGRLSIISAEVSDLRRVRNIANRDGGKHVEAVRLLYLDLLEGTLTGLLYADPPMSPWSKGYDPEVRMIGRDWPSTAQTMIGQARLRNIRSLMASIIEDGVKGDVIEAGVWRGGACIYMRGILAAYHESERTVWVADSFNGLPPPNPTIYPADAGDPHHTFKELMVPIEEVKANFAKFGLLDDRVQFLPGWFKETLPSAPIEKLALLRLDGDMYQSTMETLESLYPKVSPGGYVIVDDYILKPCKKAIHDFRKTHNVLETLEEIDGAGVYWRKQR